MYTITITRMFSETPHGDVLEGNRNQNELIHFEDCVYAYKIGHLTEEDAIKERNKYLTSRGFDPKLVKENITDEQRNIFKTTIMEKIEEISKQIEETKKLLNK